ncbi:MAG: phosphate-starvation-inducible PsiE family protein [Proteobacteria bacterium]|nr:phosphate-starvation-inducible PsiE family protein [Pseudomonadota bacterium]
MNEEPGPRKGWRNHFHIALKGRERFVPVLHASILFAVRGLALLMTLVIFWGVLDVVWLIYERAVTPPVGILRLDDLLDIFGSFLVVLIAIEIFVNIVLYLQEEVIHVRLVLATALMAAARKVIVFDYSKLPVDYVWATGLVILGLSASYWLVHRTIVSELGEDQPPK